MIPLVAEFSKFSDAELSRCMEALAGNYILSAHVGNPHSILAGSTVWVV